MNIAEKALKIRSATAFPKKDRILSMLDTVLSMFRHALEAFRTGDREAASALWKQDDVVDEIYASATKNLSIRPSPGQRETTRRWSGGPWNCGPPVTSKGRETT